VKSCRTFALLLLAVSLRVLPAVAQVAAVDQDLAGQLELSRAQLAVERQAIVTRAMELTDSESTRFWPLYREFRGKIEQIVDSQVGLLRTYSGAGDTLSDEQAQELVAEYIKTQKEKLKVQQDYMKKFRKILPARKVARYFQLETKLDAIVSYDLARTIPLIK
jgi:hypothetical protein